MSAKRLGLSLTTLAVALSLTCKKSSTGPELDLEAISQSGTTPASAQASSTVAVAFLVLRGPSGAVTTPESGKAVTFTVVSGGGSVGGGTTTTVATGSNGIASANWQLGGSAGSNVLRGSINGSQSLDVTVTAFVTQANRINRIIASPTTTRQVIPKTTNRALA